MDRRFVLAAILSVVFGPSSCCADAPAGDDSRELGLVLPVVNFAGVVRWIGTGFWADAWLSPLSFDAADVVEIVPDATDASSLSRGWLDTILSDDPSSVVEGAAIVLNRYAADWALFVVTSSVQSFSVTGMVGPFRAVLATGDQVVGWRDVTPYSGETIETVRGDVFTWVFGELDDVDPDSSSQASPGVSGMPSDADGGLPVLGASPGLPSTP